MRRKIVAGNWKMNQSFEDGLKLASEVINMAEDESSTDVEIVLCPPYIHLHSIDRLLADSKKVHLGAQNCSDSPSGAFTGQISTGMLTSVGVKYVILGHSERREHNHEDNALLAKKVDAVLAAGLTPIFCCGEALDVREADEHVTFVTQQLKESLFHLSPVDFEKVVIAYEPIWAIGTGRTASSEQAQEMHAALRDFLSSKYGKAIADETPILYGGSCKPDNAKELFAQADVDGGLIGGASLKSRDFIDIAKSF